MVIIQPEPNIVRIQHQATPLRTLSVTTEMSVAYGACMKGSHLVLFSL